MHEPKTSARLRESQFGETKKCMRLQAQQVGLPKKVYRLRELASSETEKSIAVARIANHRT